MNFSRLLTAKISITRQVTFEQIMILRDKETGVQYLWVKSGYSGGLSPLLDSDGKPLID